VLDGPSCMTVQTLLVIPYSPTPPAPLLPLPTYSPCSPYSPTTPKFICCLCSVLAPLFPLPLWTHGLALPPAWRAGPARHRGAQQQPLVIPPDTGAAPLLVRVASSRLNPLPEHSNQHLHSSPVSSPTLFSSLAGRITEALGPISTPCASSPGPGRLFWCLWSRVRRRLRRRWGS
jgi:hypothetical protein